MIHIVCSRGSNGARELRNVLVALGARAVRHRQNRAGNPPIRRGDLVVCWGEALSPQTAAATSATGACVLNNTPVVGKWEELSRLREAGVATPEFSFQPRGEEWLPRRNNHMGGHDFLNPLAHGDFYVRKVDVRDEFRVHILNGVSVRAGIKVRREGFPNPHPWVRSYDAGWRLEYGLACQERIRQAGRDVARAAVEALGLDFGAVDIARTEQGTWIVFEVNRRPGLEGNTTRVFAEKLKEIHDALGVAQEVRNQRPVPDVQRDRVQVSMARPVLPPAPRRSWVTRKGNIIFRPPHRLRGR